MHQTVCGGAGGTRLVEARSLSRGEVEAGPAAWKCPRNSPHYEGRASALGQRLQQTPSQELFVDHIHVPSPEAKSTLHHKIKALSFFLKGYVWRPRCSYFIQKTTERAMKSSMIYTPSQCIRI